MSEPDPARLFEGGRRRFAKGPPRPAYLRPEDLDGMWFTLVNALGEVTALRDRLDTHEALAEQGILPTREAVEAYRPDEARAATRGAARAGTLKRVFRMLFQDYEAKVTLGRDSDLSSVIPKLDP